MLSQQKTWPPKPIPIGELLVVGVPERDGVLVAAVGRAQHHHPEVAHAVLGNAVALRDHLMAVERERVAHHVDEAMVRDRDVRHVLVIRDLLHGKETNGELLASPEGILINILADRLKRLQEAGIIARCAYQERPMRYAYQVTGKGTELGEILHAYVRWGKKHIPGTRTLKESAPRPAPGCIGES